MKLLSHALRLDTHENALPRLEANEESLFIKPLEARQLSVGLVELDELVSLVLGVEVEDLRVGDDAAHELLLLCLFRAPLHVRRFSLNDKAVERSVSLVVGHRQHLVAFDGLNLA